MLGLSGSGKSTIAPVIAQIHGLELIEADDSVEIANGGIWPDGDDELIDRVFRETNQRVIGLDNIVYVTSWLEADWLKEFYNRGFKIIEMHADLETLVQRKIKRDKMSISSKERFVKTYAEYTSKFLSVASKTYFVISVDTSNLSSKDALNLITNLLKE